MTRRQWWSLFGRIVAACVILGYGAVRCATHPTAPCNTEGATCLDHGR